MADSPENTVRYLAKKAYEDANHDVDTAISLLVKEVLKSEALTKRLVEVGCSSVVHHLVRSIRREITQITSGRGLPPRTYDRQDMDEARRRVRKHLRLMNDFTLPGGLTLGSAYHNHLEEAVHTWKENEEGNALKKRFGKLVMDGLKEGKSVSDSYKEKDLVDLMKLAASGKDERPPALPEAKKGRKGARV